MAAPAAVPLETNGTGLLERIQQLSGRRGIMVRLRGGRCNVRTTATPGHRMRSRTASNLAATSRTRPVAEIHVEGLPTRDGTTLLAWNSLHRDDSSPRTTSRNGQSRHVLAPTTNVEGLTNGYCHRRQSGEQRRLWLGTTPRNHPPRQMTNASSLGTTSARRKTPRGFPLEGEGRRAPSARLVQRARGAQSRSVAPGS
jgi:hypothetical protein